eukprot:4914042-Ditylum_brightwellii.AAC.1
MATLNKAKKKRKERKDNEVEINAFNQFRSLNVESSNKEGKFKEEATTTDGDSGSESEASCLLSNASNSKDDIENNI